MKQPPAVAPPPKVFFKGKSPKPAKNRYRKKKEKNVSRRGAFFSFAVVIFRCLGIVTMYNPYNQIFANGENFAQKNGKLISKNHCYSEKTPDVRAELSLIQ